MGNGATQAASAAPATMAAIPLGGPTNLAQQASQDFLTKRLADEAAQKAMWEQGGAAIGSIGRSFGSSVANASNQPAPAMSSFSNMPTPIISAGTFDPRDLYKYGDNSGVMDTKKLLALLKKNPSYFNS